MIWLRTFLFTILAPGTVTVLIPYLLLSARRGGVAVLGPLRFLGFAPLLLGVAIYVWCARDFATRGQGTPAPYDPPRRLVMSGFYQFVRNPIYVGVLLIVLGEAILFHAPALLPYAALLFLAFHLRVLSYEEPTLRRMFGEAYVRYCAAVPRWLPRRRNRGNS